MVQHHGQSQFRELGKLLSAAQIANFLEELDHPNQAPFWGFSEMDAMETKWEDVIIARVFRENGAFGSAKEEDFIKN